MLSRVAENIYWMSRYVERAENTARLISVNSNLLLDLPKGIAPGWAPLIDIMGLRSDFDSLSKEPEERQVLRFLIADRSNACSILSSLHFARENCRTVRDILPRELWEQLNELYLYAQENVNAGLTKRDRFSFLKRIIYGSELIIGLLASVQSRDSAFAFLRIGRNLERADMTTRIIDVRSADLLPDDAPELRPFDTIQWVSVLHSLSAYQMYRRHMQTRVRRDAVLRYLFKDQLFPRSVRHCLNIIEECLRGLKNRKQSLKCLHALVRKIDQTKVESLDQVALHEYIDDLQLNITKLHNELANSYFLKSMQQQA